MSGRHGGAGGGPGRSRPTWRSHRTTGRCRAAAARPAARRRRRAAPSHFAARAQLGRLAAARPRGGSYSRSAARPARGYEPDGAQRRHPRAGTGTGGRYGYGAARTTTTPATTATRTTTARRTTATATATAGYSPYYYSGFYGYCAGYYLRRLRLRLPTRAPLRVLVEPSETRVYVDGYYAGVADDFDGIFQRLNLSPGPPRHLAQARRLPHAELQGLRARTTRPLKLHHDMVQGAADGRERADVGRPEDVADARPRAAATSRRPRERRRRPRRRGRRGRRTTTPAPAQRRAASAGTLRLNVRPADASVYVDGAFRGTGRSCARCACRPGRHRIEVVRPGYRTLERDVDVPSDGRDARADLERRSCERSR